ncbi:murein transglycosylase A [Komagataeibacter medellinensis]|uniref:peptidoglycan lytic exotransglycosylase n=1 Tax=Komagataeibacter medellinensis (strain NBRC 3288 / BCRC 11682 / LMG 1693 / Kondo 51) TaxID=634177 RepID=G2I2S3_KOMMN|nr:murein transglycosylase A [Komagataeibacter medellinensis]BAK85052.1 membrane-bound lytic murein transglycosylase [Komagataeibacter medellinensis NBRC 3288]
MKVLKPIAPLCAVIALCGCHMEFPDTGAAQQHSPHPAVRHVPFHTLPGWKDDAQEKALSVFLADCHKITSLPADSSLGGAATSHPGRVVGDWQAACQAARDVPMGNRAAAREFFEQWFRPYTLPAGTRAGGMLFTGYYEPEIRGSLRRGGIYQTPVYRRPPDLVRERDAQGNIVTGRRQDGRIVPYWTRAEIDQGRLAHQKLEMLWLADPVDLFFLQIQGSGRVRLPDDKVIRVGFDGLNGQPYVPLGRVMVAQGLLTADNVNMASIRGWLEANPDRAREMMEQNPNYVFFRELKGGDAQAGAPGALGVPLVPGRSLAVDRAYIPLGSPVWVHAQVQVDGHPTTWDRLDFAQDLGTDIKGPDRADLYMGWGPEAAQAAGNLHSGGQMVVLVPRNRPKQKPAQVTSDPPAAE